jgi:hypothetical protein
VRGNRKVPHRRSGGGNDRFENYAKKVAETLCSEEALTPNDYVFLLDWRDKIRINLWVGYRYPQQNSYPPNFTSH